MKKATIIEVAKLLNVGNPRVDLPWDELLKGEREELIFQARFLLRKVNARKLATIFGEAAGFFQNEVIPVTRKSKK